MESFPPELVDDVAAVAVEDGDETLSDHRTRLLPGPRTDGDGGE